MANKRGLLLNPADNVANVLEEVMPGDTVQLPLGKEVVTIDAHERIPFGFKVAVEEIVPHGPIIKYGERIGNARPHP